VPDEKEEKAEDTSRESGVRKEEKWKKWKKIFEKKKREKRFSENSERKKQNSKGNNEVVTSRARVVWRGRKLGIRRGRPHAAYVPPLPNSPRSHAPYKAASTPRL
jgi:hypothetical protein